MKKLLLFIAITVLSTLGLTAQTIYEQHTKVLQERPYAQRIAMDVDVYTTPSQTAGMVQYVVEFFVKHGTELIPHKYKFDAKPESFNVASFSWESDRQLIMHMRHTDKAETRTFRLKAGNGDSYTVEMIGQ